MKNQKLGFTLIELLIVIALLGILAVGLLAAIDPLEQFKKGRDTGTRNAVQELYNAYLRYYAIHEEYPFGTSATFGPSNLQSDGVSDHISLIVSSGELKDSFLDNIRDAAKETIFVWGVDDGSDIEHSVCFIPTSKSIRTDPNTKYETASGTTGGGTCTAGGEGCYWCLR